MSLNLPSLSKEINPRLEESLAKEVSSVCDQSYETPELAHAALKGLCTKLRAAGKHDCSYPILMIAGKMSEFQAEMNRDAIKTMIPLTERKVERLQHAVAEISKVCSGRDDEEELPEVLEANEMYKDQLEQSISRMEKSVKEAKTLMNLYPQEAPRASEEIEPSRKRKRVALSNTPLDNYPLGNYPLDNYLLLFKINQSYARICSLLAAAAAVQTDTQPSWFTLRKKGEIPQVKKLDINENGADPQWATEIQKEHKQLLELAKMGHRILGISQQERIKEMGFTFKWEVD
jgi:hypothetical protein